MKLEQDYRELEEDYRELEEENKNLRELLLILQKKCYPIKNELNK